MSAACPKFDMVWLYCSPIPVGRRGAISSFKWFLPAFATSRGRGERVRTLWSQSMITTIVRGNFLQISVTHLKCHLAPLMIPWLNLCQQCRCHWGVRLNGCIVTSEVWLSKGGVLIMGSMAPVRWKNLKRKFIETIPLPPEQTTARVFFFRIRLSIFVSWVSVHCCHSELTFASPPRPIAQCHVFVCCSTAHSVVSGHSQNSSAQNPG
jgi:hypothetical protein